MSEVNVSKKIELSAVDRQYLGRAVLVLHASLKRAANAETNPEIVRIREKELIDLAALNARLQS